MADNRIQLIIAAQDLASKVLKGVESSVNATTAAVKSSTGGFSGISSAIQKAGESSQIFAAGLAVVSTAAVGLGAYALNTAGRMESMTKAMDSVTGSSAETQKQLERLREVAKAPGLGFEEAVMGSVRLQNAGLSADMAERSLKAVGNALAAAGGGKAELDGVTLALQQIAAKGKVSAEEINQLNERLPQIRKAMKDAFGTADTEALSKMGIDADKFISGVITQFEKIPPVMGGFKNSVENLGDSWNQFITVQGGKALEWATKMVQALDVFIKEALPKMVESLQASIQWLGEHQIVLAAVAGAIVGMLVPSALLAAGALWTMVAPLIPFAAAGAAVAAVAYLIYEAWNTNFLGVRDIVLGAWGILQAVFGAMVSGVSGLVSGMIAAWDAVSTATASVWGAIASTLSAIWGGISSAATATWDAIKSVISTTMDVISAIFIVALDAILKLFGLNLGDLLTLFKTIWDAISTTVSTVLSAISAAIKTTLTAVSEVWNATWDAVQEAAGTAWEAISTAASSLFTSLKSVFTAGGEILKSVWNSIMDAISSVASAIWSNIKSVFIQGINWIIEKINFIIEKANGIMSSAGMDKQFATIPPLAAYANGGVITGGFKAFAAGGVVTEPTLGLIGEGTMNEAVVPLPNGRSIPVDFRGGGQSVKIEMSFGDVNIAKEVDAERFFEKIESRITRAVKLQLLGSI